MPVYETLKHTTWGCKYHIVVIPKYQKKVWYGHIRKGIGAGAQGIGTTKEGQVVKGHLMDDHVHLLESIPPKYAVVLGAGLLGVDGGQERSGVASIHRGARERRPAVGPVGANAALSG